MPTIRKTSSMTTGTTATPLVGDQYEFLTMNALVEFAIISDVVSVSATIYSGSDLLQQDSPVNVKAANSPIVYPDDFLLNDVAMPSDRLSVQLRNANAGTATVQTCVRITPI